MLTAGPRRRDAAALRAVRAEALPHDMLVAAWNAARDDRTAVDGWWRLRQSSDRLHVTVRAPGRNPSDW